MFGCYFHKWLKECAEGHLTDTILTWILDKNIFLGADVPLNHSLKTLKSSSKWNHTFIFFAGLSLV
jgi:hypothetical protein